MKKVTDLSFFFSLMFLFVLEIGVTFPNEVELESFLGLSEQSKCKYHDVIMCCATSSQIKKKGNGITIEELQKHADNFMDTKSD